MSVVGTISVLAPILGPILEKVLSKISDPQQRLEAELEAKKMVADSEARILEAASEVLVAETTGSKLQRLWRPLAMINFLLMINYIVIVAPWFGLVNETLDAINKVPAELWTLITIGMGGYIMGRSAEKMVDMWKKD